MTDTPAAIVYLPDPPLVIEIPLKILKAGRTGMHDFLLSHRATLRLRTLSEGGPAFQVRRDTHDAITHLQRQLTTQEAKRRSAVAEVCRRHNLSAEAVSAIRGALDAHPSTFIMEA